jgi:hypothetical protein
VVAAVRACMGRTVRALVWVAAIARWVQCNVGPGGDGRQKAVGNGHRSTGDNGRWEDETKVDHLADYYPTREQLEQFFASSSPDPIDGRKVVAPAGCTNKKNPSQVDPAKG